MQKCLEYFGKLSNTLRRKEKQKKNSWCFFSPLFMSVTSCKRSSHVLSMRLDCVRCHWKVFVFRNKRVLSFHGNCIFGSVIKCSGVYFLFLLFLNVCVSLYYTLKTHGKKNLINLQLRIRMQFYKIDFIYNWGLLRYLLLENDGIFIILQQVTNSRQVNTKIISIEIL